MEGAGFVAREDLNFMIFGLPGTGQRAEFSCDILIVSAFCEYYGLEKVRTTCQMGQIISSESNPIHKFSWFVTTQ